jgi:hypothetical protein
VRGAGTAGAEHFDGVIDVDEAVFRGDGGCPAFNRLTLHLDGAAASPADQVVVVVLGVAASVERLAVLGTQHVDPPDVDEGLQVPVNGRQTDAVAPLPQLGVQVLRTAKPPAFHQQAFDGCPLPGGSGPRGRLDWFGCRHVLSSVDLPVSLSGPSGST